MLFALNSSLHANNFRKASTAYAGLGRVHGVGHETVGKSIEMFRCGNSG